DWHSAVATFGSITDEEETVAHLSDHDWDLLLQIPKRRTKTILQGPQLQEACRNFALTGGTQGGGDWVYHLFGLINLGRGDDNPLIASIRLEGGDEVAEGALALLPGMVTEHRNGVPRRGDLRWADRQIGKIRTGGKYTDPYVTAKVVRRAVERSGLVIDTSRHPQYYLCMHWRTNQGAAEEHWWLPLRRGGGGASYTAEIIPSWPDLKIYRDRRPDPGDCSKVEVPLRSLHQGHVDRIRNVLVNGEIISTPKWDDGLRGWS